jgi:hypothetical protein
MARKTGNHGSKRLPTDLGERPRSIAGCNLSEFLNTTFIMVMCRVSNGKNIVLSLNQLEAFCTDVRHWEEIIDFINKNGRQKTHTF